MQLADERIKQVIIARKSGICILHLNYWDIGLDKELFSSLLVAITGFSKKLFGRDLREILLKGHCIFLSCKDSIIVAVLAEETPYDYLQFKSKMSDLLDRIQEIAEIFEQMFVKYSQTQGIPSPEIFLREQVELEINQTFPITWDPLLLDESLLIDVTKIRILTALADQKAYTLKEIDKQLCLGRKIIEERLSYLIRTRLVRTERIFSTGKVQKIYIISEMGKLALDALDSGFPGMWFQEPPNLVG